MTVCEHDQLKRQCLICELMAENAALSARVRQLEEALNIDREDVGRIMHESWTRTKRAQGYHHPSEIPKEQYESYPQYEPFLIKHSCPRCHIDLTPWEELPEGQKDINRHAFDDVLDELRRRANEGGKG